MWMAKRVRSLDGFMTTALGIGARILEPGAVGLIMVYESREATLAAYPDLAPADLVEISTGATPTG